MNTRNRFSPATLRALGAAAVLACSAPTGAADFEMKIGLATMNDIQHAWANAYKEALEAGSKGRIAVKIFPRNQLGTIASQIEGLQLGTIEAFVSPTDFYAGVDPRFGAFSIPVLFKDPVHAEKTLLDSAMNREILALGAEKNIQPVSVFTFGTAHYFAKQPIRSLADFKGKKMRINATAAERAKMRQFGATGLPMDLAEVVPGLQQGLIDGTMSATAVYVNLKFNDISKVITEVGDTMIISAGSVSRAWLGRLPADLRTLVLDEGAKLQPKMMEHSRALDGTMRKRWSDAGGEFIALSGNDRAKVRELLAGIGEEVTKDNAPANAFYRRLATTAQKY